MRQQQYNNKEKYNQFCRNVYIPIYSKSWWLDAVCGEKNWDVWILEKNSNILAAMPYYFEERNGRKYITKPPLTQNNGIIFNYPQNASEIKKKQFEEKVIDEACTFISSLDIDVYEQQFHYSFQNWLPFFWNYYKSIVRYTYVIKDTDDIEKVWNNISSKQRAIIKKGRRNGFLQEITDADAFYNEHEKVFLKQGINCPFSRELFVRLENACRKNDSCKMLAYTNDEGDILSVMFLVWDEKSAYQILGGSMPDYQKLDTYSALIWDAINIAAEKGIVYDFEGSVIKRISKAFREYGGVPMPYFRIRKVFNPNVILEEANNEINNLLL